jgi:competence protein ComEC
VAPYWILAAYAAGVALTVCLPPTEIFWPAIFAALALLGWIPLRRGPLAILPLSAAVLLSGWLGAQQALTPPRQPDHPVHFISAEPLIAEGVVIQAEQLWNGTSRLDIAAEKLIVNARSVAVAGTIRLSVGTGVVEARPGDRVRWRGRLRTPTSFGTPGEFDYPRYLAARNIYVTASLPHANDLLRLPTTPGTRTGFWERTRQTLATRIARAVPAGEAGPLQSLLVGVLGGITPEQRRLFSAGGLAHLYSISGLHFGLLALLLYGAARWLYSRSERLLLLAPPRRVLPPLLLLPLSGYLLLSGCAAPTQRSFAMMVLAIVIFSCHRRTASLALLTSAALVMLVISPLSLFDPSLQLSFAGVLGLMVWLPLWQPLLEGRPVWQRAPGLMLLTTLAASLATAPLTLYHFHQIAPAGLVTNLVAIPLVAWGAVPAGLLGILLVPLVPAAADLCFRLAGVCVDWSLRFTAWCLQLPGLDAITLFITPLTGLAVMTMLLAGLLPHRHWRTAAPLAGGALLAILLPPFGAPRLQVTALSVGQGDATLLSVDGRRHYLIDGGGLTGSSIDIGERLVAPALGRLGATHLSGVILTHDHPDHSAGLPYVLEHCRVDGFWSALPLEQLDPQLAEVLIRRHIPVHVLTEGWWPLPAGTAAAVAMYVPPQHAPDPNDRSIVVHAVAGSAGVLLTGDLAAAGFDHLVASGLPEPVTLLKLPHHGSRGSRQERFLDSFRPDLTFVSAGRDNLYRLPHPTTVSACRARGLPLYRTDLQGTLTFTSAGDRWQAQCFSRVTH